jgi:Cu(I)/Ag(I) efflux system membrane protein CusA/SilA
MRALRRLYQPVLVAALAHRTATITAAAIVFAGALALASTLGSEFMPPLNEGDVMFMPIADPSISLEENTEIAKRQNKALLEFPEVAWAVAKVARADTSTDPAPLNMTETVVHLKPREEWRPGMTLEKLRSEMGRLVQTPGVTNIWTMPIINRIDMLTTGIRSEVGVKILGSDLAELERIAREVAAQVRQVTGAANVYPEPVTSGQYLNVEIDRTAAARYGISVGAIQEVIETAVGETVLTLTIEGRERFPVRVRYAPEFRADPEALGNVLVSAPGGAQVPLDALARIRPTRGPAMISSENGLLLATVLLNVEGRDVGGFVEEARRLVQEGVQLPPGYYIAWSGRWENQARARARLSIVMPMVLLIIYVLLYLTYRSFLEAAHVLLAVPFALSGGVYLLWLLGYNASVAVWVGFIALFGTAVQTAVVMVVYLEEAVARKREALGGRLTRDSVREAVIEGALLRLRPKVMTVATVVAGLLPIMWSTRVGAEVMKPLATPVLGGMISSLLHVLVVTPVLFSWLRERELGEEEPDIMKKPVRIPFVRRALVGAAIAVVIVIGVWLMRGPERADERAETPIATARADDLVITLSSADGTLSRSSSFAIEFRSEATGELVDVGTVRAAASMAMPGMAMTGGVEVERTREPGRYLARGSYGMGGGWQMTLEWEGPSGRGSVSFEVHVS